MDRRLRTGGEVNTALGGSVHDALIRLLDTNPSLLVRIVRHVQKPLEVPLSADAKGWLDEHEFLPHGGLHELVRQIMLACINDTGDDIQIVSPWAS